MAVNVVLREDELTIDLHFKNAAARGDQSEPFDRVFRADARSKRAD